ncbi:MAG: peptidoglycan-binding protein [Clostridia bacterium]|nr:peptidoglycan-binding protein [Clostridia bacterium]
MSTRCQRKLIRTLALLACVIIAGAAFAESPSLLDELLRDLEEGGEKLWVEDSLTWELSADGKSFFIDRPACWSNAEVSIAYNLYSAEGAAINYFYSDAARVAVSPGDNGLYNVFVTVTDPWGQETRNIGWQRISGYSNPLSVGQLSWSLSDDGKSLFIDRPAVSGGSGVYTYAYNLYNTSGQAVNYFYSSDRRVAVTPGQYGRYAVFVVVSDGSASRQVNTAWMTIDGSRPYATYTTLARGDSGDAVKKLVTALKEQGYYTGAITSNFTSAVEKAVIKFQQTVGLNPTGVADAATQHALFGTQPYPNNDNYDMTFYPAEKIDWFTGGIQELWPRGASVKVYDVYTGTVWWAKRSAGGNHADVEPLTKEDTARYCAMYGVSTPQEIEDRNLWQRRPSLVTIGQRTFACSLYGIPHNPDGDTLPNNGMTGQVCIHFTNSRTHGTNVVNQDHQNAIEYAWNHCPAGKK